MNLKVLGAAMVMSTCLMAAETNNTTSVKQEGIKYIKILGGALKQELKVHLQKDPTGMDALAFCTGSASRITKEVNAQIPSYAKVRRTALKVRNDSENKPDNIDIKVMKDYATSMANKRFTPKDIVLIRDANVTRVYKPLVVKKVCLKCHGTTLSPTMTQALKSAYPHDKAIGFKEGDLRGVIVSEITKH